MRRDRLLSVLIWYGSFLAVLILVLVVAAVRHAYGAVDYVELGRIQIIENDIVEFDTKLEPGRPRGVMQVVSNSSFIIQSMEFEAWVRDDDEVPFIRDVWVAIDFAPNGAFYDFFSLVDNEVVRTSFLRRAPPNDSFDPATIFYYPLEDGRLAVLDYRYPKEE